MKNPRRGSTEERDRRMTVVLVGIVVALFGLILAEVILRYS